MSGSEEETHEAEVAALLSEAQEYAEKKDYRNELRILAKAMELAPDNNTVLLRLGRAYWRNGLPEKAYTFDLLKKERRYELCFEAIRWNDLRRWHEVEEIVKNQEGNAILNEAATGEYKFTVPFMQRYNDTQGGFFKIPESQVTLAEGTLEQNPGWGDGTNWAKGDLPYKFK